MESVLRESTNELKKLPSATTLVFFFLTITIIYGFIMIYTIISSGTLPQVATNSNNLIYTLIYIIFLISGTFFINVNISKSICYENSIQWTQVFIITLVPWIIIFGILYFLLELFPGWIKPFSNTIGYIVINALGATTVLKDILKSYLPKDRNSTLQKALLNIEKNYPRFINEIDVEEKKYETFIHQLSKEGFINADVSPVNPENPEGLYNNSKVIELFALINVKNVIGRLFWYVLAGTLIASISYNFIINMTCEKTLEQATKEYSDLYEKSYVPIYGKKWRKLTEQPTEYDNQDYTTRLSELITTYGDVLLTEQDNNNEVEFSNQQLRSIQFSFDELPTNSYIQVGNDYFRPIA